MVNSKTKETRSEYFPSLNNLMHIENILQKTNESVLSIMSLRKKLPKSITSKTINAILRYLEDKNVIFKSPKGITWIKNNNKNIRKAITHGLEL